MIGFHLRKAIGPRLILALVPVAWLTWVGFQPVTGTEVGDSFGPWGLGRYWAIIAPIAAAAVVPLVDAAWREDRLRAGWRLAAASGWAIARDRLRALLAGFAAYGCVIAAGTVFVALRLPGPAVAVVTVIGPLLGGYTALCLAYAAGVRGGTAARITVILLAAVLDLANALPTPLLSISGTGDVAAASWSPGFEQAGAAPLPVAGFLAGRVLLAVAATVLVMVSGLTRPGGTSAPAR
ncbi:hypothetical protein OIE66_12260 [Nonomuraea sp. NBC_01738]|uniref:hypothetical protein n=1 Tax=Nonomuraea sp. NBC_01738 TaxID=2976003 RepID=UPI002E0E870E|nr:hypothetical protein OIE66_12260 [Nonomuraea sp. NBC_01738]